MGWFQDIDWVLLATLFRCGFSIDLHELAHALAAYKLVTDGKDARKTHPETR